MSTNERRFAWKSFYFVVLPTGFMVLNSYLPEEKQLSSETLANLLATVVHRTFEEHVPETQEVRENRQIFYELFDQTRALSHKKVE